MQLPVIKDFLLPPTLTPEDFKKQQKKFDEVIPLGFGLTYKSRWDAWSSVREFVQNAFDITTETTKKSTNWRKDLASKVSLTFNKKLKIGYIEDAGSGIKFKNIFLAESKSQNDFSVKCLRGQFGEGMKFAIIPLLRDGHQVIIRTVGSDYHFSSVIKDAGKNQFDLIHVFRKTNNITKGTCIAILGLDPTIYKDNFFPFLSQKEILLTSSKECATTAAIDKPGHIFIRDVFLVKLKAYYGYNFWFTHPATMLDPDRSNLKLENTDEIGNEFSTLLKKVTTVEGRLFWKTLFSKMFATPKTKYLEWVILEEESKYFDIGSTQKEELLNILKEVVGTDKFSWAETYDQGRYLTHLGYLNLADRLPNLLTFFRSLVPAPDDLRNLDELESETILIHPLDFYNYSRNSAGRAIKRIFGFMYENLNTYFTDFMEEFYYYGTPGGSVYFYIGDFKEVGRDIGGFSQGLNIFLRFEDLFDADYKPAAPAGKTPIRKYDYEQLRTLMRVIVHEMAHVACNRTQLGKKLNDELDEFDGYEVETACEDLTQSFEDHLEEVGGLGAEIQQLNYIASEVLGFLIGASRFRKNKEFREELKKITHKVSLDRRGKSLADQIREITKLEAQHLLLLKKAKAGKRRLKKRPKR